MKFSLFTFYSRDEGRSENLGGHDAGHSAKIMGPHSAIPAVDGFLLLIKSVHLKKTVAQSSFLSKLW